VQGVGAKAAMAILGALGPEALGRALALGDWAALRAAPGVGPKTAQRLVIELKDKAQVQAMVRRLLPGAELRRADAADALAVAICHAHHRASRVAWSAGTRTA
jgi:Holliday junction DNA helicase RuvA